MSPDDRTLLEIIAQAGGDQHRERAIALLTVSHETIHAPDGSHVDTSQAGEEARNSCGMAAPAGFRTHVMGIFT
jgi:hypothetical protein